MRSKIPTVGRTRTKNKHLPKYLICYHGSHYYRGPATDWKRINLGRDYADAMVRYGALFRETGLRTFADVCDRYQQVVTPQKASRTQTDEHRFLAAIRSVFGRMTPGFIEPVHVYQFRDALAARSGATQANLHLAMLKHLCVKAIEWGAMKGHPARDVRKLSVTPRDRVPDEDELELVYSVAPPSVQVAMDLAVLTGMSRGDILALERSHCRDDGIHYTRAKTRRRTPRRIIVEWSDELRAVIARAKQIKPQVRRHIIATRSGQPFTASGFSTLWQRTMARAEAQGLELRFTFHDLRALSASEAASLLEASERLGHSSTAITQRVYRRKPVRVKPLR